MFKKIVDRWKEHFNTPFRIVNFLATIFLLLFVLYFMSNFLQFIEMRNGFAFTDPLLDLFQPIDVTYLLFILMYGMILFTIIVQVAKPDDLLILIRAYIFLLLFRTLGMYTLPLDAPLTIIELKDPFIEFFGSGDTFTKDLFFSGHTATSFLLFLAMKNKYIKPIFLVISISMATFVLLQHVHYTVDVIAAPFFAYGSFKLSEYIHYKYY